MELLWILTTIIMFIASITSIPIFIFKSIQAKNYTILFFSILSLIMLLYPLVNAFKGVDVEKTSIISIDTYWLLYLSFILVIFLMSFIKNIRSVSIIGGTLFCIVVFQLILYKIM
ncbi:hypothetical protein COF09_05395 [Bacillus toyonensis]|uniref:hypothetical protein n=1 Tax=Bacillus toyonensis TaxID=155322 RepID=UPI000BFE8218|nr:hypothetical protein [Bacillus toyonensis]PHC44604.1 hypothetical protein COF09_05395 [Bacillus toyonensis]